VGRRFVPALACQPMVRICDFFPYGLELLMDSANTRAITGLDFSQARDPEPHPTLTI
jgi:hypothetical protein